MSLGGLDRTIRFLALVHVHVNMVAIFIMLNEYALKGIRAGLSPVDRKGFIGMIGV